jgi:hypothetical protein
MGPIEARNLVLKPKLEKSLRRRASIGDPAVLDRIDKRARMTELRALRLAGIREIRTRIALVRLAKRAVAGRDLTDAELDTILPPIDCRLSKSLSS